MTISTVVGEFTSPSPTIKLLPLKLPSAPAADEGIIYKGNLMMFHLWLARTGIIAAPKVTNAVWLVISGRDNRSMKDLVASEKTIKMPGDIKRQPDQR